MYLFIGMNKGSKEGWSAINGLMQHTDDPAALQELSGALQSVVRSQFDVTVAWLSTQPRAKVFDPVRNQIAAEYARTDPATATRTAAMIADERNRLSSENENLLRWLAKDPSAAQEWARSSDLSPADIAEAMAAVQAALIPKPPVDYAEKMAASQQIDDEKARHRAQWGLLPLWLQQDRSAALAWMAANTYSDSDRSFYENMKNQASEQRPAPAPPGAFPPW